MYIKNLNKNKIVDKLQKIATIIDETHNNWC